MIKYSKKGGFPMEAVGIIAEYNPFHNGHLHHLLEAKKKAQAEATVCVISGNFTQRGETALLNKWKRAELAARCGADLVIELPFVFAVRSAQDFARGGVRLLSQLPAVKSLAFGSEHPDLTILDKISTAALSESTKKLLQNNLKTGQTYAAAMASAVCRQTSIPETILKEPNTILAVEYLNAIKIFSSNLTPLPIKRETSHYNDSSITAPLASAKAIRNELASIHPDESLIKSAVPKIVYDCMQTWQSTSPESADLSQLFTALLLKLRQGNYNHLRTILGVNEGLEHKLIKAAISAKNLEEFLALVKSKRYPNSRLQRLLLYLLFDLTKKETAAFDDAGPLYARILAATPTGCKLLSELKKQETLPIITKTTDYLNTATRASDNKTLLEQMLSYDTYATDLYSLCFPHIETGAKDFTTTPFILQNL
jgi:predicted nucleotidyltransferase